MLSMYFAAGNLDTVLQYHGCIVFLNNKLSEWYIFHKCRVSKLVFEYVHNPYKYENPSQSDTLTLIFIFEIRHVSANYNSGLQ